MNILSIVHRAIIVALILPFTAVFANAQNPSLEFTTDSRVAANGPTLNSGAFTFYGNSDNPTGTTYAPYSPALTVTFSIDNPQATTGAGIPAATGSPVNFGYLGTGGPTGNNAIIARMSLVGVPQDIYYTSSGAPTGTGMAAASAYTTTQSNYVVTVNQSTAYLDTLGTPLTDMPYQADLTITFNRPVNNPILHISGMGGVAASGGFSARYELISSVASTPVTFSKLSGTSALAVAGDILYNSSATMNTFGDNAASGSILISGKGITSIKFKVSLQSDGRGTAWSITSTSSDGYSLGISLLETDLAVTNTVSNTTPSVGDNVTFTIVATNNGISNSTNTGVSFVLPSGYTFVSSSVPPGTTYDPATGIWTIGDLPNGASSTITIVATVTSTNNYTSTATISGDNSEPDYTNNVDDAVVAPTSLPVTFGNVQATFSGNDFIVSWKSLTENNNDHFEIEVSTDGKLFKKLTKLQSKAVNGNSTLAIDYMYKTDISNAIGFILPAIFGMGLIGMSRRKRIGLSVIIILLLVANISCNKNSTHVDKSIDTKVYVRIVQVDKDGTKSYSKIVQAVQN